jgi:hypothetical protein
MNVADLKPEGEDALGFKIICIYARKPPEFAIYRTAQRVLIHFADDQAKSDEQRRTLVALAPLRGEINGLVDGWRTAPHSKRVVGIFKIHNGARLHSKAERYDRASADALQVGLEGDLPRATLLLEKVKADILNERTGWARFEYLITAFATAIVIGIIAIGTMALTRGRPCADMFLCLPEASDMWRGFIAGAVGAFFSIALGIRGRTILTDLYRPANLMDAVLRVIVGAIGGVVLVSLIRAGFVRFSLGDSSPDDYRTIHILIVGFVAGFTERLVPDLLAKADARTGEPAATRLPEPSAPAAEKQPESKAEAAAEAGAAAEESDVVPGQESEESCVADESIPDNELTDDQELPAASGGVDKDQQGT